jgi:bifunctional DNA-binding transcriptional regulator/antitoxin component of YhaV-PrlF toxin-antitoxin module
MKVRHREIIGQHGEVRIPKDYQEDMGLSPGEEVEFRREGQGLLIERVKEAFAYKSNLLADPVKELTGSLEIDPKLAQAILEADYQPEEA